MFGIPAPTAFDLKFRLLRIPVRVSPWFWLVSAMMFSSGDPNELLLWVPCVFLSILVHEMGHGLVAKSFGGHPQITLHGMGGLCSSEGERTFGQRLAVILAGPGAQLLLLGLLLAVAPFWLGISWRGDVTYAKSLFGFFPHQNDPGFAEIKSAVDLRGPKSLHLFFYLFEINLFWPLLNLLPLYPLDGGQATQTIWSRLDPRHGARRTHILSMLTAGIIAAYFATRMSQSGDQSGLFRVIFFGYFAFINYQLLQAYHQKYEEYGADDADWWKR
jgi:membrane-associated protease RseP (regulator of RpoE activity)